MRRVLKGEMPARPPRRNPLSVRLMLRVPLGEVKWERCDLR